MNSDIRSNSTSFIAISQLLLWYSCLFICFAKGYNFFFLNVLWFMIITTRDRHVWFFIHFVRSFIVNDSFGSFFFQSLKKLISYDLKIIVHFRVSIRKTFAQFFAERNAKFFFLCASVLREKTTVCAIIRKSHFAQNCPIPILRSSSFAQFRN